MYNQIFFTNILRILEEKNISKEQLSEMSGVSMSFISDLTNGKGNPSLRIMERIADSLDEPLPALLEETDMDTKTLDALSGGKPRGLKEGYERVSVILPAHQAFIARQWAMQEKDQQKKKSS